MELVGAEASTTRLVRLKADWDAFFQDWLAPAAAVVLPALAVLAVLLVLTRLVTAAVVPPDDPAWGTTGSRGTIWRRSVWGVGFAFLLAAAGTPLQVSTDLGRGEPSRVALAWFALVAAGALLRVLTWGQVVSGGRGSGFEEARPAQTWRSWTAAAGGGMVLAGVLGLVLVAAGVGWARDWAAVCWVAGLGLAALGVVWVAAGRGQSLRLRVEILDDKGAGNSSDAEFLIGRLQKLGSEPPDGLQVPRATDVTGLPVDSLADLPAGGVAKALVQVAQVVLPAVPWHITVASRDEQTVTVAVDRNGRAAGETVLVTRGVLQLPRSTKADAAKTADASGTEAGDAKQDAEATARARAELLTAAAAVVLVRLSGRHRWLKAGLCGASSWKGVAAQVIATEPAYDSDPQEQRRILLAGLDDDPRNALARLALTAVAAADANDGSKQKTLAEELLDLHGVRNPSGTKTLATLPSPDLIAAEEHAQDEGAPATPANLNQLIVADAVEPPDSGYDALQLRVLYSTAAAWLNVVLYSLQQPRPPQAGAPAPDSSAWVRAVIHTRRLVVRLQAANTSRPAAARKASSDGPGDFISHMRGAAYWLWKVIDTLSQDNPRGWRLPPEENQVGSAALGDDPAVSDCLNRKALYDRACFRMIENRNGTPEERQASLRGALNDLAIAASDERVRRWARRDPSFWLFQSGKDLVSGETPANLPVDELRREFKKIVGDPPPADFLALSPFKDHAKALRSHGIIDADDLLGGNPSVVGLRLGIEPAVIRRWQRVAELTQWVSQQSRPTDPAAIALVALLLEAKVWSCDQLRRKLENREELHEALVAAAVDLAVMPTSEIIDSWSQRASRRR